MSAFGIAGPVANSGGAALTFTDGTNTVDDVAQITVIGGVVGGSSPDATLTVIGGEMNKNYVPVAAGQSNHLLGGTGAIGDYLNDILVIPASTSPGAISIKDSSGGSSITVFAGGTSSINDLTTFTVTLGFPSQSGGWYVTTGANVSVIAAGTFT